MAQLLTDGRPSTPASRIHPLDGATDHAAGGVTAAVTPSVAAELPAGSLLQRYFQHKGKKRVATTYNSESTALPTIFGTKPDDLQKLADDDHNYGSIENKAQVTAAMVVYAGRHPVVVDATPLEELQDGNVTVATVDELEQAVFAGTVRLTLQLDWLQGKHDQPFMRANSTKDPRKMQDSQMRLSFANYEMLAQDVPVTLTTEHLARIFARAERKSYDYSVMGTKQSDDLYYEISAMWETSGPARHVLVYYHCFPDKVDEKNWQWV